jgi:hypothetical protein
VSRITAFFETLDGGQFMLQNRTQYRFWIPKSSHRGMGQERETKKSADIVPTLF